MSITTVFGFDMETDIGSWTPWYNGFRPGTENILRVLKENDVRATFFFTGDAASKNPEVVAMVRDAGHEIGAHSLYHETVGDQLFDIPGMIPPLPEEVFHRLERNTEIVERVAGVRPSSFRSPRLFGSTAVCNALEDLGYHADASYPMYYYRERLEPYHPSREDWTKIGDLKLVELPNFADLSMESHDPYGRDMDQWPLWRTEDAEAVMKHLRGYCGYCTEHNANPFICMYMHPWEFAEMPKGLLYYGEGAVLPDQTFVKNCGEYATEQFDVLVKKLKEFGSIFKMAKEITC